MTGGRAYFPQSARDFEPMYREIASALRHQYVLGIRPAHDGQFHSLGVRVMKNDQPALAVPQQIHGRILARAGYLAPAP
jgi:hypothetical protein